MKTNNLDTKEQIIVATKELLQENGNVTIKDISEKAFVNVAAINYHFGSKDKLIHIVIEEVITDLRNKILNTLTTRSQQPFDFYLIMEDLIEVIFKFAENNTGIISYSFIQMSSNPDSTNILINFFLADQGFTDIILSQLKVMYPDLTEERLFAKYLIFFSSFAVPFFLNFLLYQNQEDTVVSYFNLYRDSYLEELRLFLKP